MATSAKSAESFQERLSSVRSGSDEFFTTAELKQRFELLSYLIGNSEIIPVLVADPGAGKTRMAHRLQGVQDEPWFCCYLDASGGGLDPDRLYAELVRGFEVEEVQEDWPDEALLNRFEALYGEGLLPVLLLDSAEQLPDDTLTVLITLYETSILRECTLRPLLFSRPGIEPRLDRPSLQGVRAVQWLDLPRFNREDAEVFVRWLQFGGLHQDVTLSAAQLDQIYQSSDGLPGRLRAGLESLQAPRASVAPKVNLPSVNPLTLIAGAGVVVALLLVLLFQERINSLFNPPPQPDLPVLAPVEASKVVALELPEEEVSQEEVAAVARPAATPLPSFDPAEGALVRPLTVPEPEPDPSEVSEPEAPRQGQGLPEPLIQPMAPVAPQPKPVAPRPAPPAPAAEVVPPKKVQPPKRPAPPTTPRPPAIAKPTVPKPPPSPPAPKALNRVSVQGHDWLKRQRPGNYTLQLVGVQSDEALQQFLHQYKNLGDLAVFESRRGGNPWYSVLHGVYKDRQQALGARGALPLELRNTDIWPRTFESVQKALR